MVQPEPAPAEAAAAVRPSSGAALFWERFRRHRLGLVGAGLALLMVLVALLAPVISPHNPTTVFPNGLTPGGAPLPPDWRWNGFFFGTDSLGRDVLSQLIWGARVSMEVGVFATLIATVIGVLIGAVAGYYGGVVDNLVMRFTDIMLAFPFLLFVILLESVVPHPNVITVYSVIGVLGWAPIARIARGQALAVAKGEYVEAARAIGASTARIILRHVIPNILGPLVVVATLSVANNIVLESALSFLGVGVPDPTPSWGKMIAMALGTYQVAPWLLILPSLAVALATLGFNLLGDGLNDALNPRRKVRA
jgi:peptide/nickel transport system permease protein